MDPVEESLLARLVGLEVASVAFVRDYLELEFGSGARLFCYAWPTVEVGGTTRFFGDVGYRDALCALIDQVVLSTEEAVGIGLLVRFGVGALSIHPTLDELEGPEIAMLSGFADQALEVWRPGEHTFADLE